MEATETAAKKVTIRPDTTKMVKGPKGSFHKDDFIGHVLSGLSVDQVCEIASEMGIAADKYTHLNRGQIRMTLGTALRKLANNGEGEDAASIENMAEAFKEQNEAAAAAKVAAKEAAAAEKAAAKPKRAKKAKVSDNPEGEGDAE